MPQAGAAVIWKSAALGPEMVMQFEAANTKLPVPTLLNVTIFTPLVVPKGCVGKFSELGFRFSAGAGGVMATEA